MDKFPHQEDGYYLQQRPQQQQQRSPRFPARSRQENLGTSFYFINVYNCYKGVFISY